MQCIMYSCIIVYKCTIIVNHKSSYTGISDQKSLEPAENNIDKAGQTQFILCILSGLFAIFMKYSVLFSNGSL